MACPNCGSESVDRYCARCGQAAPLPTDYSLRAHAGELLDQVTSIDAKLPRTVWTLVSRPGRLTEEHLAGRRARYLRPVQLFLLVNLLLFVAAPSVAVFSYSLQRYLINAPPSPALVSSLVQRAVPGPDGSGVRSAASLRAYAAAFDARVETHRKTFVVLFVPALALVLRVSFARRRRQPDVPHRYGEHLVFAFHLLAFVWLSLAGTYALGSVVLRPFGTVGGVAIGLAALTLLVASPVYALLAVRRVYRTGWLQGVAHTAVLAAAFMLCVVLYRGLLFFTTYYSL